MIDQKTNRRALLLGAAFLGLAAAAPALAQDKPVDVAELHKPSAIGEMEQGPADAKVVVVEYASASCPHCAAFFKDVYLPLKKDYIDTGKVRFIMREFPHNDLGMAGFMVARCAPKEKYFPILDVLFATQEKWMADPLNGLKEIAKQAGMTEDAFNACLKNEEIAKGIFAVREQGSKFGVESIPTIFINGEKLSGEQNYEEFKKKVDALLG